MIRYRTNPYAATITERSKLAQEIRNELQVYKRLNGPFANERRDKLLERVDAKLRRIVDLEGLTSDD